MKHLLFFIGIGVILGTVGACDVGKIGLIQAIMQCLVGVPMVAIGVR